MKLNFRTIEYEDTEAAYALECASFSAPWPRSAFEEIVTKENADYFLVEDCETKTLIGGCVLFYIIDEGDIFNVAVRTDYQGKGIGTQMLNYLIECGEKKGIKDFTLEVRASNEPAIRLYEKCGFVSEGIRPNFYTSPTEDAVIMWRRQKD